MAWASFWLLFTSAALILYGVVLSPERESIATSVAVAGGALTGLFTVFTTIVVGYLGISAAERVFKKEDKQ